MLKSMVNHTKFKSLGILSIKTKPQEQPEFIMWGGLAWGPKLESGCLWGLSRLPPEGPFSNFRHPTQLPMKILDFWPPALGPLGPSGPFTWPWKLPAGSRFFFFFFVGGEVSRGGAPQRHSNYSANCIIHFRSFCTFFDSHSLVVVFGATKSLLKSFNSG